MCRRSVYIHRTDSNILVLLLTCVSAFIAFHLPSLLPFFTPILHSLPPPPFLLPSSSHPLFCPPSFPALPPQPPDKWQAHGAGSQGWEAEGPLWGQAGHPPKRSAAAGLLWVHCACQDPAHRQHCSEILSPRSHPQTGWNLPLILSTFTTI